MGEKLIVLAIVFGGTVIMDMRKLRQASPRERVAWCCMIAVCIYLGIDLLSERHLPQVHILVDWLYGRPVRGIERWLQFGA